MVIIVISPFAPKRILALLFAILTLSALRCFADSSFLSVSATPYDHQMSRIQPVLISGVTAQTKTVSLETVNRWMSDLRGIPYGYSLEWKTPQEVAHGSYADCKGKAVALYREMRARGASNLRLIVGRRTPASKATHAWLEWKNQSITYVLDPTWNWSACPANKVADASYVPYYAYSGARKFRALTQTSLYARL